MVVHTVVVDHKPTVLKHADPTFEGVRVECNCGWYAEAYDPPGAPMWFKTAEIAVLRWTTDHGAAANRKF